MTSLIELPITGFDLENLECGIAVAFALARVLLVPEGHLIRTPSWADRTLTITWQHRKKLQAGETVQLASAVALVPQ